MSIKLARSSNTDIACRIRAACIVIYGFLEDDAEEVVARMAGMSVDALRSVESGDECKPSELAALAYVLGVSANWILGLTDK